MNLATLDIGTNTTLLLVARVSPDGALERVEERAEITRLGRGIGAGGALGTEGISRTLDALREFAAIAQRHDAAIAAVGTEALRRAPNAAAFLDPAAEILGGPVEVIDGAREAALTFRAVAEAFPDVLAGALVVVDIGGGSTEIVIATRRRGEVQRQPAARSVRLTEGFIRHDPPRLEEVAAMTAAVDAALAGVPFPVPVSDADHAGRRGGNRHLAGGDGRGAGELRPGARPRLPALAGGARRADRAPAGRDPGGARADHRPRLRAAPTSSWRARSSCSGSPRPPRRAEVRVSDRGIRWGLMHELAGKLRGGARLIRPRSDGILLTMRRALRPPAVGAGARLGPGRLPRQDRHHHGAFHRRLRARRARPALERHLARLPHQRRARSTVTNAYNHPAWLRSACRATPSSTSTRPRTARPATSRSSSTATASRSIPTRGATSRRDTCSSSAAGTTRSR